MILLNIIFRIVSLNTQRCEVKKAVRLTVVNLCWTSSFSDSKLCTCSVGKSPAQWPRNCSTRNDSPTAAWRSDDSFSTIFFIQTHRQTALINLKIAADILCVMSGDRPCIKSWPNYSDSLPAVAVLRTVMLNYMNSITFCNPPEVAGVAIYGGALGQVRADVGAKYGDSMSNCSRVLRAAHFVVWTTNEQRKLTRGYGNRPKRNSGVLPKSGFIFMFSNFKSHENLLLRKQQTE